MSHLLWRELLDNPTQAFDSESAGLTLVASGGHVAHQYAIRRWLSIRVGDSMDTHTAISVILAEVFNDTRALEHLANSSAEPYPEQLSRFDKRLGPDSQVARVFGQRILEGLRSYLSDGGDLPFQLLAAAARFHLDDDGEVYLRLRYEASERTTGTPSGVLGESFADRALEAAAAATPNRANVQQTVLSHWGVDFCATGIPFEESRAGFAPTRWIATCNLIVGVNRSRIADRLIDLAFTDNYWRTPSTDSLVFIHALRDSCGATARAVLEAIGRADAPNSPEAFNSLQERDAKVQACSRSLHSRIGRIAAALADANVFTAELDERTLANLTERFTFHHGISDSCIATELLIATHHAVPLQRLGQFEPPIVEAVAACRDLLGSSVGLDCAFLEPRSDPDSWVLRFLRDGLPHTRSLTTLGNELPLPLLEALLREFSVYSNPDEDRRFRILDSDYADATLTYLDKRAWEQLTELRVRWDAA